MSLLEQGLSYIVKKKVGCWHWNWKNIHLSREQYNSSSSKMGNDASKTQESKDFDESQGPDSSDNVFEFERTLSTEHSKEVANFSKIEKKRVKHNMTENDYEDSVSKSPVERGENNSCHNDDVFDFESTATSTENTSTIATDKNKTGINRASVKSISSDLDIQDMEESFGD